MHPASGSPAHSRSNAPESVTESPYITVCTFCDISQESSLTHSATAITGCRTFVGHQQGVGSVSCPTSPTTTTFNPPTVVTAVIAGASAPTALGTAVPSTTTSASAAICANVRDAHVCWRHVATVVRCSTGADAAQRTGATTTKLESTGNLFGATAPELAWRSGCQL